MTLCFGEVMWQVATMLYILGMGSTYGTLYHQSTTVPNSHCTCTVEVSVLFGTVIQQVPSYFARTA